MLCSPLWGIVTDYFRKPKLILLLSIFGSMIAHWSQSIVSPFVLPCYPENTSSIGQEPGVIGPGVARSVALNLQAFKRKNQIQNLENLYKTLKRNSLLETTERTEYINQSIKEHKKRKPRQRNPKISSLKKTYKNHEDDGEDLHIFDQDVSELFKESKIVPHDRRFPSKEDGYKDSENEQWIDGMTLKGLKRSGQFMIKNKKIKSPKPKSDFRIRDNKKIFITLLILIIFGEMVAAPAPMLTDSGTLMLLSGKEHEYGRQRLFGSLGWGGGALLSGAIVTAFHFCPYSDNINYVPTFYVFVFAMFIDLIVTSFFKFKSEDHKDVDPEYKRFIQGLKLFADVKNAAFIFVLFFFGFSHSLKLSFLFWFLQDIGGTPILFTLIVLINSLSEVLLFFVATYIVKKIGHDAVLYIGLWCYGIKFLLYSYINHPWYVLPLESLQGVTYGLMWTACVSYVVAAPGYSATIQGIIHGVYWGLGMAVGGVLGGFSIHVIGARTTFRITAACSLAILIAFFTLNNFFNRRHREYDLVSAELETKETKDESFTEIK